MVSRGLMAGLSSLVLFASGCSGISNTYDSTPLITHPDLKALVSGRANDEAKKARTSYDWREVFNLRYVAQNVEGMRAILDKIGDNDIFLELTGRLNDYVEEHPEYLVKNPDALKGSSETFVAK